MLKSRLGVGGMGSVWLAQKPGFGGVNQTCALKLMGKPDQEHAAEYRRRFETEVRISDKLRHRNIVRVFDSGEEDGECYLVMTWVDGMDLRELLTRLWRDDQNLPLPVAAFIVGEVLQALEFAQSVEDEGAPLGVVHRDVSPTNVLISTAGEVLLSDFGVARQATDKTTTHKNDQQLGPGKMHYMAPEQVRADAASVQARKRPTIDLYSVGAILHELLEGRPLRDSRVQHEVAAMAVAAHVPALEHARDIPRELDELRQRLLDPNPDTRVQTATQALEMLTRWPGYRLAHRELGRICLSYSGAKAPRSSPILAAVTEPSPAGEATNFDLRIRGATPPPAPRRTPFLFGIAGFAVALTVGGVAAWQLKGDEPAAIADEPVTAGGPIAADSGTGEAREATNEPAAGPVPEPGSTAQPSPEPTRPPEDEPAPADATASEPLDASPGPTTAAEPDKPSPAKEKAAKSSVTFKTGDFTFVWVKVRGKVLALEPTKKVELPAGRHRVSFRVREQDPWKSAGTIKLAPGASYAARMEKPGKISLEKQ